MNPDLAKALGEIERGVEKRLRAKRAEFEKLQQELGEGQKIVGHVEKVEEAEAREIEIVQVEEDVTAEVKMVEVTGRRSKMQSVAAIKVAAAKDKPQKKSGKKEMKWRRATDKGLGDFDLQEAMEDTETGQTMTTTRVAASTSASTVQTTVEVYAKPYSKSAESRGERSSARQEKKKTLEKELKERQEKESREEAARLQERKEQHEVVERALLDEEERKQQEMLERMKAKEARKKRSEKQTEKEKQKEARKRKYIEEEEAAFVDNEDKDPDFNPEGEFIAPDDDTIDDEEEDTFQVEKHSHALNFTEAGEFVVWVRGELRELQRKVRKGKDMEEHYKTFVMNLKDGIVQVGSYAPIEAADVEGVMKTVVDPSCMAWKKAMQGVKTGDSKSIMKKEEKRVGIIRVIEDRDIPLEDDTEVVDLEQMKEKTREEKMEVKRMLRKFWAHVSKAHEEAACAAGKLARLSMVLDEDDYYKVVQVGTRPLIAMEIPQVKKQVEEAKNVQEWARSHEEMRNMRIEDIIIEQNLPTPLERWKGSKVLLPTRYLAAAVHYLVYSQADEAHPMTNKHVAEKFVLSPSNLHRILIRRRYVGGHETAKTRSEDLGERYTKVAAIPKETSKGKGKGKGKLSSGSAKKDTGETKVTVTKVRPQIVPLPFPSETPAESTRGAKK